MPEIHPDAIAKLNIVYEDYSGDLSQRSVSVLEFNPEYITGFCHLRQQERTFAVERIISCVDAVSGEVAVDPIGYLAAVYAKSSHRSVELLYQNHHAAIQALVYVAAADGQIREAERKVLSAACRVITGDVRITDDQVRQLVESIGRPGLHAFKVAVGKVQKRGNEQMMKRLLIACKTIVGTQKTVTATEQEALDYMAKRFNLPA